MLAALRAVTSGGLTQLADTVSTLNTDITLSTEQLGTLLTSVVIGWVGTVGQAITNVLHDPLAVTSYIGVLSVPLDMIGLGLTSVITAADDLGANALSATNTVITGITAQISNAVSGVEKLVGAAADLTGIDLIEGVTTATQGVVSAVVMASVAGVNGVSGAAASAATDALHDLAGGAYALVDTWLGNGTSEGALQNALSAIGSAPLDGANYTEALNIVVGAAIHSGAGVVHAAGSLVSIPFSTGARLTTAAAKVITSLVSGVATASSGVLQAMGLGPVMSNLPYGVATVVNGAVQVAAAATAAGLNTIAKAIDIRSAATGVMTGTQAVTPTLRLGTATTTVNKSTHTAAITATSTAAETATAHAKQEEEPEPSTTAQAADTTEKAADTVTTKGTDMGEDSAGSTEVQAPVHPAATAPPTTRDDAATTAKHASPAAGPAGRNDTPNSGGGRHRRADTARSAPAAIHSSRGRHRSAGSAPDSHGSAAAGHSTAGK